MQTQQSNESGAAPASQHRLRILHVVPTYYPAVRYGGPIRSVHALCASLARRGHDVTVYTTNLDGPGESAVPLQTAVPLDDVQVYYFRVPALRRLHFSPDMQRHLAATVDSFDVIHLHSVYLWPTYAAARLAERARIPYVVSPRGMLIRDVIRRKNAWVKRAWIHLVERRSLARAAALHVTAPIEGDEAQELQLPVREMVCIPNGVDGPRRVPALSDTPFASIARTYALFLSRISWKKGLDRLIKAWQFVPDLPLVIAGNDDEDYQPQLERLAQSLGIAERIHFVGAASDATKWALYANAEMFVLPSYSENFGNVVAEAMIVGCPVIVTSEVGLAPLVERTGAGVICGGEPEHIARAVNQLHLDSVARRRMGKYGQHAAQRELSWDAVGRDMEAAYLRAMMSSNGS